MGYYAPKRPGRATEDSFWHIYSSHSPTQSQGRDEDLQQPLAMGQSSGFTGLGEHGTALGWTLPFRGSNGGLVGRESKAGGLAPFGWSPRASTVRSADHGGRTMTTTMTMTITAATAAAAAAA